MPNFKKPAFWLIAAAVVLSVVLAICFLTRRKQKPDEDASPSPQPGETRPAETQSGETSAPVPDGVRLLELNELVSISQYSTITWDDLLPYYCTAEEGEEDVYRYPIDDNFALFATGKKYDYSPLSAELAFAVDISAGPYLTLDVKTADVRGFIERCSSSLEAYWTDGSADRVGFAGYSLPRITFVEREDGSCCCSDGNIYKNLLHYDFVTDSAADGLRIYILSDEAEAEMGVDDSGQVCLAESSSGVIAGICTKSTIFPPRWQTAVFDIDSDGESETLLLSDGGTNGSSTIKITAFGQDGLKYAGTMPVEGDLFEFVRYGGGLILRGRNLRFEGPELIGCAFRLSANNDGRIEFERIEFVQGARQRQMTIEDALALSQKGEALTTADLAPFFCEPLNEAQTLLLYRFADTHTYGLYVWLTPFGNIASAELHYGSLWLRDPSEWVMRRTTAGVDIRTEDAFAFVQTIREWFAMGEGRDQDSTHIDFIDYMTPFNSFAQRPEGGYIASNGKCYERLIAVELEDRRYFILVNSDYDSSLPHFAFVNPGEDNSLPHEQIEGDDLSILIAVSAGGSDGYYAPRMPSAVFDVDGDGNDELIMLSSGGNGAEGPYILTAYENGRIEYQGEITDPAAFSLPRFATVNGRLFLRAATLYLDPAELDESLFVITLRDEVLAAEPIDGMLATSQRMLTLDDVLELSKKGMELTWEDFAEFRSDGDIGSGMCIVRFPTISERFNVLVGGDSTEGEPLYVLLICTEDDDSIEIRTEDVQAFLDAHGA